MPPFSAFRIEDGPSPLILLLHFNVIQYASSSSDSSSSGGGGDRIINGTDKFRGIPAVVAATKYGE
jgi:hypothetical protein